MISQNMTSLLWMSLLWMAFSTCSQNVVSVDALLFPKPPSPAKLLFLQKKAACRKRKILKKKILTKKLGTVAAVAAVGGAAATVATIGAAALIVQQQQQGQEDLFSPAPNSLQGQTILITGGTTGLGLETAKRLALGDPAEIILTARSATKGDAAIAAIEEYLEGQLSSVSLSYRILDLDNLQELQESVASWLEDEEFPSKIDCLVNNAGIMAVPDRESTMDGIERQMQSNHLGHFVLTSLLQSRFNKDGVRIINVSSSAHQIAGPPFGQGMDFSYCWTGEPNYNPWKSYGQSKLANILFSQELQRKADQAGLNWEVACLHPGGVSTDLGRYLLGPERYDQLKEMGGPLADAVASASTLVLKTPQQGATTSIYLASGAYTEPPKAQYFVDSTPQALGDFATSQADAAQLWKESEERAGITFEVVGNASEDEDEVSEEDDAEQGPEESTVEVEAQEDTDIDESDADDVETDKDEDDSDD